MTPTTTDPDPVERLLAACLALPEERRAEAFERAASKHPDLAEELARRAALLFELGMTAPVPLAGGEAEDFPEELGDYRLLERIGGGGMGVVYRAEQISLGREVALKLIRPEHLYFPRARERFRREVEAVARLQHRGIVPVHTVGEERGVPFFAMQLVEGCTLAEALAALGGRAPESLSGADLADVLAARTAAAVERDAPVFRGTWPEACVELARQVAEALHHAHEQGVVHRDVKPSNVVLTPDGRALLIDFGLTSSGGDERLTRTGSQLGTPLYMAPEQLRGAEQVTPRADVYSLGVTLYELLTLQVPYRGDDALATQRLIQEAVPDSIHARNRRVPPEAETVCLTAMERDAHRRYASAAELARDLARVQERRPIRARPPGATLRLRRWAQRNPARATALALGSLLLFGIPTALGVQQTAHARRLAESLERERLAREEAQRHSDRAEAESRRAVAATREAEAERDRARSQAARALEVSLFVKDLFQLQDPGRAEGETITAREILDRGAERLRARTLEAQPITRAALLEVIASVYRGLGLYEEALPHAEVAVEILRGQDDPTELAVGLMEAGRTYRSLGRHEESRASYEEALALRREALAPGDWRVHQAEAELGTVLLERQRYDEARGLLERAVVGLEENAEADTLVLASARNDLGKALLYFVRLHASPNRDADLAQAEELFAGALALLEADPGASPVDVAAIRGNLGQALKEEGRLEEAVPHYRASLEAQRAVFGPEDPRIGVALVNLAALQESLRRPHESIELLREGAAILAASLPPGNTNTVIARGNLAGLLSRAGYWTEAEGLYDELIPLQRSAFAHDPIFVTYSLSNLGLCRLERGAFADARASFEEAMALLEELRGPTSSDLVKPLIGLARLELERGDAPAARARLDEARRIAGLGAAVPDDYAPFALVEAGLARLAGDAERAADHYRVALERGLPGTPLFLELQGRYAECLAEAGRREEAEGLLRGAHAGLLELLGGSDFLTRRAEERLAALSR